MDASASVDVSYQINDTVLLGGGLNTSIADKSGDKFNKSAHMKIKIINGANNVSIACSVTDKSNGQINKECTASASIKF